MSSLVGNLAPDFTATAILHDNAIQNNFTLSTFLKGKKGVLFFYPLNFTFVCPSEIIAFDNTLQEFSKRNTEIIGISVDSYHSHLAYKNQHIQDGGIGKVKYPLVSDLNKNIAKQYDVLHNNSVALRATFLIDEDFYIKHQLINDLPIGRNVYDIIRVIDALSHHQKYGDVCPANWQSGQAAISPTIAGVK